MPLSFLACGKFTSSRLAKVLIYSWRGEGIVEEGMEGAFRSVAAGCTLDGVADADSGCTLICASLEHPATCI